MIHQRYRQTDRQTDRQTTCDLSTALCTVVHHAVKTVKLHNAVVAVRTLLRRSVYLNALWVIRFHLAYIV